MKTGWTHSWERSGQGTEGPRRTRSDKRESEVLPFPFFPQGPARPVLSLPGEHVNTAMLSTSGPPQARERRAGQADKLARLSHPPPPARPPAFPAQAAGLRAAR